MLEKLAAILRRGGTVTVNEVARELDTSPEMVGQLIDHMTSAGWLRQLEVSCEGACNQCVFVRDCQRSEHGRVWQAGGER
jgi:hypothetical protein